MWPWVKELPCCALNTLWAIFCSLIRKARTILCQTALAQRVPPYALDTVFLEGAWENFNYHNYRVIMHNLYWFQMLFQELLNQYQACLYLNTFPMVIPNIVMKFQNCAMSVPYAQPMLLSRIHQLYFDDHMFCLEKKWSIILIFLGMHLYRLRRTPSTTNIAFNAFWCFVTTTSVTIDN